MFDVHSERSPENLFKALLYLFIYLVSFSLTLVHLTYHHISAFIRKKKGSIQTYKVIGQELLINEIFVSGLNDSYIILYEHMDEC